jgi:hypothetical protein
LIVRAIRPIEAKAARAASHALGQPEGANTGAEKATATRRMLTTSQASGVPANT